MQPPSLLISILSRVGQHLFTLLAGALASYGVIQNDQQTQVVAIGLSVLTWAAGYGWNEWLSWRRRQNASARVVQAAQTGVAVK